MISLNDFKLFSTKNMFIKPFNHIRKRNLIKRFNGIEDYDPLLPLFRLIIGLLRLYLFMLIFEWIATTFINIRDEPVVMGHEARLPYLFTCNGFPFPRSMRDPYSFRLAYRDASCSG